MKKEDFVSLGISEEVAQTAAAAFGAAVDAIKFEGAVDEAIRRSGAKNDKAVRALLVLDSGNSLEDLQEQLEVLKNAPDSEFLFEKSGCSEKDEVRLVGAVSGETGREIPDNRVDFSKLSYSELCKFLESNPRVKI